MEPCVGQWGSDTAGKLADKATFWAMKKLLRGDSKDRYRPGFMYTAFAVQV